MSQFCDRSSNFTPFVPDVFLAIACISICIKKSNIRVSYVPAYMDYNRLIFASQIFLLTFEKPD